MGRTRVAVVQIAYHPAIVVDLRSPLEDPLWKKPGVPDALSPAGGELPEGVADKLQALRRRVRAAYGQQLLARVKVILEACRGWGVRVVVFPEYSIPSEILGQVASAGGEMVVIAGTHTVDRTAKKSGIYESLKSPVVPLLGQAVCPVLHEGRLLALLAKLNPAVPERTSLKRGDAWDPVELPGDLPGPLGVMVCLDFLFREGDQHRTLVGEKLGACRFLAVPSLTPWYTLPEFAGKAWEEARRYARPVLYCDHAEGGGTAVYVDEGHEIDLKSFPEHAGWLDPGDEGVIVADVDLGYVRPGESTRYDEARPVVPVAAASLVYRATPDGDAYGRWLKDAESLLASDEEEAIEALAERMKEGREVLRRAGEASGGAVRKRRLGKLGREIEGVMRVEQIRQLTREVVVPPGVLPPAALRMALARGAAEEIGRWAKEPGAGSFAVVAEKLREECGGIERKAGPWTGAALLTIKGVSAETRGGPKPVDEQKLLMHTGALEGVVDKRFSEDSKAASSMFLKGHYAEAKTAYLKLLADAEEAAQQAEELERPKLREWVERCRFNVALAAMNLQEIEEAAERISTVDPTYLTVSGRLHFAETLALMGERERAESLLPDEQGLAEEDRAHLREVRQTLELLSGRVPADLVESPEVRARASAALLVQGNLLAAAQLAREALVRSGEHPLISSLSAQVLVEALRRTIYELPPCTREIPVDKRHFVLDILEGYFAFDPLRDRLPRRIRELMQAIERMYRSITGYDDWTGPAGGVAEEDGLPREVSADPRIKAFRLAQAGKVDDALKELPADTEHPWRRRFDRIQIQAAGGKRDVALDEALALAAEFPGRPPIEKIVAQLCGALGRTREALQHATRAFEKLPSRGYALLLAAQYLNTGHAKDAWDLVKDIRDEQPRVLRVQMVAAEQTGHLEEAERLWKSYVTQRPEDIEARVSYAQILYRMDRRDDAAAVGWSVYIDHPGKLDLERLYVCGWLQEMGDTLLADERGRRILKIATELKNRFPGSAEAIQRRQQLLSMLGPDVPEQVHLKEEDLNVLVAQGWAEKREGMETLLGFVQQQRGRHNAFAHLAKSGVLPASAAAHLTNTPISLLVTRLQELGRGAPATLCPPIALDDVEPPLKLKGAKILVSDLELVLLESLDLTAVLRGALGPDGRLVILPEAQNRLHWDFSETKGDANREELNRTEALLRRLDRLRELPPGERAEAVDPAVLFAHLRAEAILDEGQYKALQKDGAPPARMSSPPERLAIPWTVIDALAQQDALEAAFTHLPNLFVSADARPRGRAVRDQLTINDRAADLSSRVHKLLGEPWVQKEARAPDVSDLPPLRDATNATLHDLVVRPLAEMIAHRRTLIENPEWWWLSTELYSDMAFGVPAIVMQLAWPSEEVYQAYARPLGMTTTRDLTLPKLIRMLGLDRKSTESRLLRLVEWGFVDALGADEIVALMRRFHDLGGAEPRRLLDVAERAARDTEHQGAQAARRRLAYAYGAAIFKASFAEGLSDAQRQAMIGALLQRQEILADESLENTLDQSFATLASATSAHWATAFRRLDEERATLDTEGPVARMWQVLSNWAGDNGPRRNALERALAEIWRALSVQPGGPPAPVIAAMELAHWPLREEGRKVSFLGIPTSMEALLILSGQWKENPFNESPFAPSLAKAQEHLLADFHILDGRFPMVVTSDAEPEFIPVPVEALLLRASPKVRQRAAAQIREAQGPYDGGLYHFLSQVEATPADDELLRKYAGYASLALFRLVQADPAYLRVWGQAQRVGPREETRRFDELLRILSEPNEPLLGSAYDSLRRRFDGGPWSPDIRLDAGMLFVLASEIPGTLPAAPLPLWLEDDEYEDYVASALYCLDHTDEQPVARLAGNAIFLRVASTRRPLVKLPEGEVDLREILPARLQRLLESVSGQPKPDTYAATEAPLLRVCGEVVQRLAHPQLLPLREGLWLTWRLFQWLCLQLDSISPDARRDGIRRLIAKAPPVQVQRDVLDPFGFGRDPHFDHRLAAVLHALGSMEELVAVFKEQNPTKEPVEPRRVSSPALESKLLELAHGVHLGPNLGSVLDWNAPGNVPDLALQALLQLSMSRFADVSPEARSRRFRALPDDPEAAEKSDPASRSFANLVVLAAANCAGSLTPDERTHLEAKLRAMKSGPQSLAWRWVTFVSLFEAGVDHLEDEAFALAGQHVADSPGPVLVGRFLLGVAARDVSRVEPTVEAIIAAADAAGTPTEPGAKTERLAVGLAVAALGRLLAHGTEEGQRVAQALLLQLAEREGFREDPRMNEVIGFFGLRDARP